LNNEIKKTFGIGRLSCKNSIPSLLDINAEIENVILHGRV
jgi:hypothetical protein